MNYQMNFISAMVAEKLNELIPGTPVENRVLIITPNEIGKTASGLIIPDTVKEGKPRKGVIVKVGAITEEYQSYKSLLQTGIIVEYGLYAGKEHQVNENMVEDNPLLKNLLEKHSLTVLDLNEISYIEPNNID